MNWQYHHIKNGRSFKTLYEINTQAIGSGHYIYHNRPGEIYYTFLQTLRLHTRVISQINDKKYCYEYKYSSNMFEEK
jgi:hypothetical protein